VRKIIFKILRITGLPFLFRELWQKNRITILLFHDISAQSAEKVFKYLRSRYSLVDLNELVDRYEGNKLDGLPKKPLIITFDDGHLKNYDLLPVIQKYEIPVTIFLCASIVDTKRQFWFQFDNLTSPLQALKRIPNKERLQFLKRDGFDQEVEYNEVQALQKEHIEEMKDYINFQSHTLFHPILPFCTDQEAREEIVSSKSFLEEEYGLSINAISYPNGDYSERDIELSRQAGYKSGLTVDYGFNSSTTDPFRLKRLSVNDTEDLNELAVKASGLWGFFKTLNGIVQKAGYHRTTV